MPNLAPLEAANLRRCARKVRDWSDAATLWDIGDGATVFELNNPDALITPEVITALGVVPSLVANGFESLILTSSDPRLFAFGAAGPFRHTITTGDAAPSLAFLRDGQATLFALRSAPIPVVVAVHGVAFSGACEVALFANGLVVEEAAPLALKEIWVGPDSGLGRVLPADAAAATSRPGPADCRPNRAQPLRSRAYRTGRVGGPSRSLAASP